MLKLKMRRSPGDLSGRACAMRAKSSDIPRSDKISHVRAQIMTPAPISLNWAAASYTSTWMSAYLDNATASVKPPIPPPLGLARSEMRKSK